MEGLSIPEDADEQLQGHLLDLAVELLLPGPPGGPALVHVCAGAEVSQVQLVVQLKALDPGEEQRDSDLISDVSLATELTSLCLYFIFSKMKMR